MVCIWATVTGKPCKNPAYYCIELEEMILPENIVVKHWVYSVKGKHDYCLRHAKMAARRENERMRARQKHA